MIPFRRWHCAAFLACFALPGAAHAANCAAISIGAVPINDLGTGLYLNMFQGGLYPGGSNTVPVNHANRGLMLIDDVQPLNPGGNPDPDGNYVLLSIGMSNASQEFGRFVFDVMNDPQVNRDTLAVVNGAQGGETAPQWTEPDMPTYDNIRDQSLTPLGLTEAQVQIVWIKNAIGGPELSLPDPNADAYLLLGYLGDTVRALQVRYPNLRQVFVSSRTYGGYSEGPLNPEPFAYETGFAFKWLVEAQIRQMDGQGIDPIAGDLEIGNAAPWIAWGPYLWADGLTPRSDGLTYACEDFIDDGVHPSELGGFKVRELLLNFFLNSPFTEPWFRSTECPHEGDVDGNSQVTPNDALLAFQHFLMEATLDSCQEDQADVDGKPNVTPADALQIFQRYLDSN